MFRLAQTAPDCLRALVQVRGSPFDCAGLGSTDWMRMACKRPGVRVPLAPLHFKAPISNTKPIVLTSSKGQNEGQALGWLASVTPVIAASAPAAVGLAVCKRS